MQLSTKLVLLVCACATSVAIASQNGLLYGCDFIDNTNGLGLVCDFVAAADVDIDPVPHDIQSVLDATNPANRIVADPTGKELPISPKPWGNGDVIAEADTAISGYYVNYVRAFEIVAPLRDLLMYQADAIDKAEFDKWTKSFVDCDIKAETVTATPFDIVSVADTWTNMFWDEDPSGEVGPSQHNWILQFLEEGAIDLVCITTDLEMDHCDEIRSHHGMVAGDVSSCWVAGYEAAYGVAPEYFDGEAIVNADTNTDTSNDVNPDIDGPTPPEDDSNEDDSNEDDSNEDDSNEDEDGGDKKKKKHKHKHKHENKHKKKKNKKHKHKHKH